MIRKTLIIVTLLTIANLSYAQHFGLKAGPNYSNVVPDNGLEYGNYKAGFHGGVYGTLKIIELISIRSEILFSQKGYVLKLPPGGFTNEIKRTINYLSVPLIIEVKPIERIRFHTGAEFNYQLSVKESPSSSLSGDSNDLFNKSDIGILLGFGVKITDKIQSDIRYVHGLSSLNKSSIGSGDLQNRLFQLSIGYQLF
ncbi:porin family protein [Fulvivirga sp.]|uniref:porin family protein n=1 Tax=Fulvivirga sp. TaxID=1931237 RepID=UPI0032EC4F49